MDELSLELLHALEGPPQFVMCRVADEDRSQRDGIDTGACVSPAALHEGPAASQHQAVGPDQPVELSISRRRDPIELADHIPALQSATGLRQRKQDLPRLGSHGQVRVGVWALSEKVDGTNAKRRRPGAAVRSVITTRARWGTWGWRSSLCV